RGTYAGVTADAFALAWLQLPGAGSAACSLNVAADAPVRADQAATIREDPSSFIDVRRLRHRFRLEEP
ncbi:MAG TPA: hypothetical protein VLV76_08490, partial [Candidatus Acidoferrum sp.]|nr:hypothetical protein [Candidatus Acidoferrum sp.]